MNDRRFGIREALTLVVLGVAAGVLATLIVRDAQGQPGIGVGAMGGAQTLQDWLTRTTKKLREGRDKLIADVDKLQGRIDA